MKIVIENGGTKLDWVMLEDKKIHSSKGINVFDSDEKILSQIQNTFPSRLLIENNISIDFYTAGLNNFIKKKNQKTFYKSF